MIDLGVYCLGLFFDKLCATFSGMDQIGVHKTTVWRGLLDYKKVNDILEAIRETGDTE